MCLKSPEELFDLSSLDQHFSKHPDRFLVWNGIGQRQPQKLLEREPVVDLVLCLLIREIVLSLQHEHLEHHHYIMAGAAAGPPGLRLNGAFQILPKYLPVDPGVEPRQWVRAALQLLQAAFIIEQSGLLCGNGVHTVFYHIASRRSADLCVFTEKYLSS
jgi:hypothetical protein